MSTGYFRVGLAAGLVALLQALAAPLVCVVSLIAATWVQNVGFNDAYIGLALVSALLCYISMTLTRDWSTFVSGWSIARKTVLSWIGVVALLLLIGYATKFSAVYSRRVLFTWFLITAPLLSATLVLLQVCLRRILTTSGNVRSAVIAGVSSASRKLAANMIDRPELGLTFKGYFDDRGLERLGEIDPGELLGRLDDLPIRAKRKEFDAIFIAIPISQHMQRTRDLVTKLRDTTASIYFVPDIFVFDLIQARTDDVYGIPVLALCETPFHGWRGLVKRSTDITLATLMLLIAAPAMLAIALAIKLSSPGKIIFLQRRYGLEGEEIVVYKFRTMNVSDDGTEVPQAQRNDSRTTSLGRFLRRYSLDELPQLVNVLQGRMSVVGPRPHAVAHNEEYRKLISGYMVRHKVAPGITGLAQVNGFRGETVDLKDMEGRVHYDLEYLRHWSLLLDVKIVLKTLRIWFRDEKAY